jgi:hypothetical protein
MELFQAARWLGVPPWELLERSIYWQKRAVFYQSLDGEIRDALVKQKPETKP